MAAEGQRALKEDNEREVVVTDHARDSYHERIDPTGGCDEIAARFNESIPAAIRIGRRGQREGSHARINPITATVYTYVDTEADNDNRPVRLITTCYPWTPTSSVTIRGVKLCGSCWLLHRPDDGECAYCGADASAHPEADSCTAGMGRWFDIENNDWNGTTAPLRGRINRD